VIRDDLAAMIFSLQTSLMAAEAALDHSDTEIALMCIKASRAAVAAVCVVVEEDKDWNPDGNEEEPIATDDPETCGHPDVWELPGQRMCRSCGCTQTDDGSWKMLN
jgi:hypothetical protein